MASAVKLCSVVCISSEDLNYAKHPMVSSQYRFHVYYHIRRVLKRLQVALPHEAGFSKYDHPYNNEGSLRFARIMEFLTII